MPALVDHQPTDGARRRACSSPGRSCCTRREDRKFLPADTRGRVAVLEWLFWQMAGLGPMSGQMGHFNVYAPEQIPYAIERYGNEVRRLHGVMDKRTASSAYGRRRLQHRRHGQLPRIGAYDKLPADFAAFPNLKRWHDAIAARPATQRAYALKHQST